MSSLHLACAWCMSSPELPAHYMPEKNECTCTTIPLLGGSSRSQIITECISFAANLAQFGGCKGSLGFEWDFPSLTGCFGPGALCLPMI